MACTCIAVAAVSGTCPLPARALLARRRYAAEQRGAQTCFHTTGVCVCIRLCCLPVCEFVCSKALERDDPCIARTVVPEEVRSVLGWMASVSEDEEMAFREAAIAGIEAEGAALRQAGQCCDWLADCEENVARVSRNTNGPLIEALSARAGHVDDRCADLLRRGAWGGRHGQCVNTSAAVFLPGMRLYGVLEPGGFGQPTGWDALAMSCGDEVESEEALRADCMRSNLALLSQLREDANEAEVMRQTQEEADLGRMSPPILGTICATSPLVCGAVGHMRACASM